MPGGKDQGAASRARRLAALKADPNHPRHGTRGGAHDGCDCRYCIAEQLWYYRERRSPEMVSEAIDELALILAGAYDGAGR